MVRARAADKALAKELGEELRRAREKLGWSRAHMVTLLPSEIGERTLLAYEKGLRQLTVARLTELCEVLGLTASSVVALAIQRARIDVANLELIVDLRSLVSDRRGRFWTVRKWATNKLNECPDGIAMLAPAAVQELATLEGCGRRDLIEHFVSFTPDCLPEVVNTVPADN